VELTPERIVERERRWSLPVAISCFLPLALFVISLLVLQGTDVSTGGDGDRLRAINDDSGPVLIAVLMQAAAFLAMAPPFVYLLAAAAARNPRVQRAFVAFAVLGSVLFAAQAAAQGIALRTAASDFVAQAPQIDHSTFAEFQATVKKQPDSIEKVTLYTDGNQLDVERKDGGFTTTGYPSKVGDKLSSTLDKQNVEVEEDSGGVSGDALARRITDDSSELAVAQDLLFPALLAMVVGVIYTALQAMRVGLLTRFYGTLGMAFGASLILLGQPIFIALWLIYLGLLIIGRLPGGVPPAWAAGEAIPWPRPGDEQPPARPKAPVDGTATEVSGAQGGDEAADSGSAQRPAQKRKRKRRR
jgi:hypothetical protein